MKKDSRERVVTGGHKKEWIQTERVPKILVVRWVVDLCWIGLSSFYEKKKGSMKQFRSSSDLLGFSTRNSQSLWRIRVKKDTCFGLEPPLDTFTNARVYFASKYSNLYGSFCSSRIHSRGLAIMCRNIFIKRY